MTQAQACGLDGKEFHQPIIAVMRRSWLSIFLCAGAARLPDDRLTGDYGAISRNSTSRTVARPNPAQHPDATARALACGGTHSRRPPASPGSGGAWAVSVAVAC